MPADNIRINGFWHSWPSTKITIGGEQYAGITKISWDHAIEEGVARGQGGKPLGRTRGQYTPGNVVITMRKSSSTVLKENLAKASPDGKTYGSAIVPIVTQYLEPNDTPITVEKLGCRLIKVSTSNEQGADPSTEDLEFSTQEILENGMRLFSDIVV